MSQNPWSTISYDDAIASTTTRPTARCSDIGPVTYPDALRNTVDRMRAAHVQGAPSAPSAEAPQ